MQHIVGLSFNRTSPEILGEAAHLARLGRGLQVGPGDLNLALRLSLFANPHPHDAMAYLFPTKMAAESFQDSVRLFGPQLHACRSQPHPVEANTLRPEEAAPTIAFAAAGRQKHDSPTFVLAVTFEQSEALDTCTRLTDRLVASQGGRKFDGTDVARNGLFVFEFTGRMPQARNIGADASPHRAFYDLGSEALARNCVGRIAGLQLGQASRHPRV